MKRNLLLSLVALFLCLTSVKAQYFTWLKTAGGTNDDEGRAIALDASGNLYATGMFYINAMFDSTALIDSTCRDVYVAKYAANGSLTRVIRLGGLNMPHANNMAYGEGITVDMWGNVYVCGNFVDTLKIDTIVLRPRGLTDCFIAKFDSALNFLWAKSAGSINGDDRATGIVADTNGFVNLTGQFIGSALFDSTAVFSTGNGDYFVARYDSAGTLQWVRNGGDIAESIALDNAGNIFITGEFSGTSDFGTLSYTSIGAHDIFVAKYDTSGTLAWVKTGGGIGDDHSNGISIDGAGNIYIAGAFNNDATFGTHTVSSMGQEDAFTAKLTAAGVFQWVSTIGGPYNDASSKIAVSSLGALYVTGSFDSVAVFGTDTVHSHGKADIFLAKYVASTGVNSGSQCAGSANDDFGVDVICNNSGTVYLTGSYSDNCYFGPTLKTSRGGADIFFGKLNTDVGIQKYNNIYQVELFPNPANTEFNFYFSGSKLPEAKYSIIDIQGKIVLNGSCFENRMNRINISSVEPGLYFLQVLIDGSITTKKLGVVR